MLASELPKRHRNAFFRTSKQAFESASQALIAAVPSLSDSEVAVRTYQLGVANVPVDTLVLDLRDNTGGDSNVLQPLIGGVQSRPWLNRADHFFVLIGRRTFSSALLNAIQLDQQTNATLVGEPTGGKPNSYGEILNFRLPSSGLTVFYSTKFFEVLPGNDAPSLAPEVAIATSASAYLAGHDPVVDYVLPPPARRRGIRK